MGALGLLITAIAFVGLAYIYYEPIPEGLKHPWHLRLTCAKQRTMYYIGSFVGCLGFSKGIAMEMMLEERSSVWMNPDPSVIMIDHEFDGVNVRMYIPQSKDQNRRGVIYYHGGGFVVGGAASYHGIVEKIAIDLNAVTFLVLYRKAPTHVYPAAVDDCEKATVHIVQHASEYNVDSSRIAIMGDSAGGNLAAAIAIRLRNNHSLKPKLQVLIYPLTQALNLDTPSYRANDDGPFLTKDVMMFYFANYLFGHDYYKYMHILSINNHTSSSVKNLYAASYLDVNILPKDSFTEKYTEDLDAGDLELWEKLEDKILDPSFSPLFEEDMSGLPHTYVSSCQCDVLRDDAFFYVKRLEDAGVKVQHDNLHACYHPWLGDGTDQRNEDFHKEFVNIMKYIDDNL